MFWITEPPWNPSFLVAGELRAVLLGLALGQQYPVWSENGTSAWQAAAPGGAAAALG
jgi:hypothetical protein